MGQSGRGGGPVRRLPASLEAVASVAVCVVIINSYIDPTMPPLDWPFSPVDKIQAFQQKYSAPGEPGALFSWAYFSVESLHYLDDLDRSWEPHEEPLGHNPDMVDVAHARWATVTAITALDLCVSGLARVFCGNTGRKEWGLSRFDPSGKSEGGRRADRRAQLPKLALDWVDTVCADPNYQQTREARRWLTHSRLTRHLTAPRKRLDLTLQSKRVNVRDVVEDARDVATHHVTALLKLLPRL